MVSVFKNVGERSTAKNDYPVSLFFEINKVFEKLVGNKIVDQVEKCGLFSDFMYGFRSFSPTSDLPRVVSARISWVFNRSDVT